FLAHALDIVTIENLKEQTKATLHFFLPLPQHRWGAYYDDFPDSASEEQLDPDEPGLDGFPEANVVGYKEIHPRQKKGFAERFKLVRVDLDAGAPGTILDPLL